MSKFYESHRSGKDGIYVAKREYNRFPSHFHQNVEIFVLLSGKQEIVVDGISFTAESGSVVFIDNFSVHSYGDSQKG
jgi:mannose-6-phosphate isomerase-like protein (cupin superfamily)